MGHMLINFRIVGCPKTLSADIHRLQYADNIRDITSLALGCGPRRPGGVQFTVPGCNEETRNAPR